MLKKAITYCLLVVIVSMAVLSCSGPNSLPSLSETYSRTDKNPFGTYVAFRQVNEMFYRNDVRVKRNALDKSLENYYSDKTALYICISQHFYLRSRELNSLLDFVKKGNNAFVSSRYFDSSFLKEINLSVNDKQQFLFPGPPILQMKRTSVQLSVPPYADNTAYGYYYLPCKNSIAVPDDAADIKVLGLNEDGNANFVVVFYGKGRIYIHCEPRVFGNYFLLKENNYKYLQRAFSFMPRTPDNVFWDDYYNRREFKPASDDDDDGHRSGSTFSVVLKYPPMAWAFWLTLLALLLYILFGSKRRQRIIKPLATNENTTVAFTETVGRLYLQKKDNRNMADKMITYLLEHIRNQYFINTNHINEEFITLVSRKSGIPHEDADRLFSTISKIQRGAEVDDELLLSLNKQIENFYKYK